MSRARKPAPPDLAPEQPCHEAPKRRGLDSAPVRSSPRTYPPETPLPRLTLRLEELAESLGISRRTLERERAAGRFPRPDLKVGKAPLWTPDTIRRWIESGKKGEA